MAGTMLELEADIPPRNMKKHLIVIGFKDDEKSNRTIPRNRLLQHLLNKVFKCEIEFLLDQFGEVLYPEQWLRECQAKPYYYTISKKQPAPPVEDAEEDPDYMGDSMLFVEHVPKEVDAVSLETWLKTGIQSETTKIVKLREHVHKAEVAIRGIEAKISEVPFLDVSAPTEKEAAEQRKQIADLLNKEIDIWEAKLKKRRKMLRLAEHDNDKMELKLEVFEIDKKDNTHCWLCTLPRAKGRLAGKMTRKPDWREYKLALMQKGFMGEEDSPPLVLYGRRAEFPVEYEDDNRVVNMQLVRVTRRRHGTGGMVHEDDNEYRITPNWIYRGDFRKGRRHGTGTSSNYCSIYTGQWEDDLERHVCYTRTGDIVEDAKRLQPGPATIVYADGSQWTGEVGRHNQVVPSLFNGNEYGRGLPHGQGTFTFADGSQYQGVMHNGQVQGQGSYKDAHTGTFTGTFQNGMLQGPDCRVERKSVVFGEWTMAGEFNRDALDGKGTITLPMGWQFAADKKRKASEEAKNKFGGTGKKAHDSDGTPEYHGAFTDGTADGLLRGSGGCEAKENRWIFEGIVRDGHREGMGEQLYETAESNALLRQNEAGEDGAPVDEGGGGDGGSSEAQRKIRQALKDFEREEKEKAKAVAGEEGGVGGGGGGGGGGKGGGNGNDGTLAHRRLPLRYAGLWEKSFIMNRGIHSQKLAPGRFAGQYTFGKRAGEDPKRFETIWNTMKSERNLSRDVHRADVRHWRDHRRVLAEMAKHNQHHFRAALLKKRIEFFDDDLWDLMTEEEQAAERNTKNAAKAAAAHSELRVAMRRAKNSQTG
jgi:hypothetical protein